MSFEKLIAKVQQAEDAIELRERALGAQWDDFKATWRASWTPGRIVVAGLASGFLVGRSQPGKLFTGGGTLQMIGALSSLFAGGSAQAAAGEAESAAQSAQRTASAVSEDEAVALHAQTRVGAPTWVDDTAP